MTDDLARLEESLWLAETRFDRTYMEGVLTDDFAEFGRSGRRYDRRQALAAEGDRIDAKLPLEDFTISMVSTDVALVTYISEVTEVEVLRANRSSLWVRTQGRWRLRFHQGTPIA